MPSHFTVSDALLQKFADYENPHLGEMTKVHFLEISTDRLDITPTKAPMEPTEPISIERLRESITIRLERLLSSVTYSLKKSKGKNLLLYTVAGGFVPELKKALFETFCLDEGNNFYNDWLDEISAELYAWLKSQPDSKIEYPWAILSIENDANVHLSPTNAPKVGALHHFGANKKGVKI
ncbi:MAG: hypothetical protein AAB575_02940 [Patescibacteria group bacterium]